MGYNGVLNLVMLMRCEANKDPDAHIEYMLRVYATYLDACHT